MEDEVSDSHLDFKVKQLIHLFEKRCYTKVTDTTDLPQSLHENKRKPNEDRATQDITKTTVLIVKTQSVDEDSNNKKKKPIKEVLLHKIDSLSDHERSSDEDTKPTKKTHLHASVVTHANNGVTHGGGGGGSGGRSSADEKRRLDEIEEQLKITRIENERLRTQLSSLDKKFAVREAEDLRSKKDHDEQLKHWMASANKQLEETNRHKQACEKTKEELGRVKAELLDRAGDRAKSEHDRSLKEATAKAAELSKQLAEKEKLIAAMREKHENGGGGVSKTDRELEVERNLRLKLTEELEEANRKILSLTSQVEAHEKAVDAHRRSVQELGNETRLRKKQEKLLEEAKEMVNTLGKQIEEKDRQLKAEKERCRRSNSQEQEQAKKLQDDAKGKLIAVTQKLEETAKELENSKSELSKEKAQKRNQETMLLEANKKISELSRLLNERDGELAAVKLEHEKAVRRRSSNPFETQTPLETHVVKRSSTNPFAAYTNNNNNNNDDDNSTVFLPDVPNTGPLINLYTGADRPRRKKNHPSRISSTTQEQSGGDDSDLSS